MHTHCLCTHFILSPRPPHTVEQLTALLEEAKSIPVILQLKHTISEALGKAKSWSAKARTLLVSCSCRIVV